MKNRYLSVVMKAVAWLMVISLLIIVPEERVAAAAAGSAELTQYPRSMDLALSPNDASMDTSPGFVDFGAADIVDWVHFIGRSGTQPLRYAKADVTQPRIGFIGQKGSGNVDQINDYKVFAPRYTNGVNVIDGTAVSGPTTAERQRMISYGGTGSAGTFYAPSVNGVERTFEVYLTTYGGKVDVTATIGNEEITPVESLDAGGNTTIGGRYTFKYTGDENEEPLKVELKMTTVYDATWGNMNFMGACIRQTESGQPANDDGSVSVKTDWPAYGYLRAIDPPATDADPQLGIPQIDDNLSAPNVVDWVRFTGNGGVTGNVNGITSNRKKIDDSAVSRLTYTATKGTGTVSNDNREDRNNLRLVYSDGENPLGDSSSKSLLLQGANSAMTFTAPSKAGVERKLDIYVSYNIGSATQLSVAGYMGSTAVTPVTGGFVAGQKLTKYTFTYTGTGAQEPLVATVKLTGGTNIGFYGARITEGSDEPYVMMTSPDMQAAGYAVNVPDSLFNRRKLSVRAFDESSVEIDDPEVSYSYTGISPQGVKGSSDIAGITIENGMLYVRNAVTETIEIDITASVTVDGTPVSVTRRATINKGTFKDYPANPLDSGAPLGKAAEEWELFFHDEFSANALNTNVWSPYYLHAWEQSEGYSKSQHELVKDEDDNGYLALTSSEDMTPWTLGINAANDDYDGTHRISGISTFERKNLHLGDRGRGQSADLPVFDGQDINTKYGYFELRMRLPNTGDGAHFAWWMVGVQDDQHPDAKYSGPKPSNYNDTLWNGSPANNMYPVDGTTWGSYNSYYTNQGVEYDILESTLDKNIPSTSDSPYNGWLPVQHKNGSRDFPGRWFAGSQAESGVTPAQRYSFPGDAADGYTNGRDAYNEFHVYGYEWDETGTKFYIDGRMVYSSPRTASYRMMTFLSVYAGKIDHTKGGYGFDYGYWPKEAMIDYLRIYKKAEEPKPNDVVLNEKRNTAWDYFYVPATGTNEVQLTAQVLDQFDQPYELKSGEKLKWRFSDTVGGVYPLAVNTPDAPNVNYPASWNVSANHIDGITLDEDTGLLTIPAGVSLDKDLFVTAYVDGVDTSTDTTFEARKVRATKHVKLSSDAPQVTKIVFIDPPTEINQNSTIPVIAKVYDQYMNEIDDEAVTYSFSEDIGANQTVSPEGLSLDGDQLSASESAVAGNRVVVTAKTADGKYQSIIVQVEASEAEVDKDALEALIEEAGILVETEYTASSWAEFSDALAEAEVVFADADATQEEVDQMCAVLQEAIDGLELLVPAAVDKTALEALIKGSDVLDETEYTASSWVEFSDALSEAEVVFADVDATQEEVNQMCAVLQEAIDGLELLVPAAVDKTELEALIKGSDVLDETEYTALSWSDFSEVLAEAEVVFADPDATQEEVDTALSKLQKAINDLVKKVNNNGNNGDTGSKGNNGNNTNTSGSNKKTSSVQTGDTANSVLYIILLLMAFAAFTVFFKRRHKTKI